MEKEPCQERPSSRRSVLRESRQPGNCEIRSTLERPKDVRILPELENPERMPMATTTIKRTTSAWAWQVITDDGRDCRQRAKSSRAAIRTRRHEPVHRPDFADRRAWPTGRCFRFPVQAPRFGPDFVPDDPRNGDSRAPQHRFRARLPVNQT